MLSKAKIKLINSLKLGKFRKQHGLFVAEGATNVTDFMVSGSEPESLYATETWIKKHENKIKSSRFVAVSDREMKRLSNLKNPSEVFGVFKIPETNKPDLSVCNEFILMLEDIRDPGNLGTIIRTADWFGFSQIICSEESVDAFNPKVVQASMGSLARVSVHYDKLEMVIASKPDDLRLFAAVLDGYDITKLEKPKKGILLIGSEAHGISESMMSLTDQKITIPNKTSPSGASAESLNASVAAAILCYEFTR